VGFIQIVEENEPFAWTPEAEDGSKTEAAFTLQVLSDESLNILRRKHTHTAFQHGQRVENFDSFGFAADVVDQALVDWEGVIAAKTGEALPCDRKRKLALPERLKVEILRLCAGKEAGRLFGDGGSDPNASSPSTSTGSGTTTRP
jgi:hypothetical protein